RLTWATSNVDTLSLNRGIGEVESSYVDVSPNTTTSYTLTASNAHGSITRTVQVNVDETAEEPEPIPESEWTWCADEWGWCTIPAGRRDVRIGAGDQWVVREIGADNWIPCSGQFFGPSPAVP